MYYIESDLDEFPKEEKKIRKFHDSIFVLSKYKIEFISP